MRSEETSNDFATTADVISEVLNEYEKRGIIFDVFACIYPTAPFVSSVKLSKAMDSLITENADGVVSVVRYSFPPQRAFVIQDGKLKYQYPQYERSRNQDLEPIYHDCGQFYICFCNSFLQHRSMILQNTIPFIIPENEVQDIDNISDWLIAEAKFAVLTTIL